jgi:DNA-directed RNA polymerase
MQPDQELLDAQLRLEQKATSEGYYRYLEEQKNTQTNEGAHATAEGRKLIKGALPLVTLQVLKWIEENDNKGKGKTHTGLKTLKRLDPDVLAYIALNSTFNGVTIGYSTTQVQVHIGTTVEQEIMALELEEARGRKVARRIHDRVAKQGSSRMRKKAFKKLADDNIEWKPWETDFKVRIGEPLLNAVLLALPEIFELATISKKGRMQTVARLTNEGAELLIDLRETLAWNQPVYRPMVVPPRPWTDMNTGCYYDEKSSRRVKLVRTHHPDHKRMLAQAIDNGQLDYVMEALNYVQAVAWSINGRVLDVVEWAYKHDVEIGKLPLRKSLERPQRLPESLWEGMDDQQRKGYRIKLRQIEERNRSIAADKSITDRDIETARELSAYDRFYLPHNLDFRGRVYPVCHFSHQRSDHVKALLQFADGCPLGESGGAWLSIHLANTGDFEKVSKRSFDDRLDWVAANEAAILSAAADPQGTHDWWGTADKPFSFLAACFEYADWVQSGRSEDFESRIPVALDGSNSGLQHYSAALRAEDEAALVSLTPSEVPADLYQTVADDVVATMERDASEGSEIAKIVLAAGIGRKEVKRNVMTFPYSSEQYGFRQQLMEDLMAPLNLKVLEGKIPANPYAVDGDGGFAASGYIAAKVYRSVTNIVHRATDGMTFFKKVAGALAHEKKPLVWTTPIGLPVMHKYSEWDTKSVQLFLYDRRMPVTDAGVRDKVTDAGVIRQVRANIRTKPLDRIDKDKARSAVAPNVIHSMDGAHLMLTVLEAKDAGIHSLALIHDSFGTHAGRTAEFFGIIRKAFIGMYENYDPFEEVLRSAEANLSDPSRLPPMPEKGDLDLSVIDDALYAFA